MASMSPTADAAQPIWVALNSPGPTGAHAPGGPDPKRGGQAGVSVSDRAAYLTTDFAELSEADEMEAQSIAMDAVELLAASGDDARGMMNEAMARAVEAALPHLDAGGPEGVGYWPERLRACHRQGPRVLLNEYGDTGQRDVLLSIMPNGTIRYDCERCDRGRLCAWCARREAARRLRRMRPLLQNVADKHHRLQMITFAPRNARPGELAATRARTLAVINRLKHRKSWRPVIGGAASEEITYHGSDGTPAGDTFNYHVHVFVELPKYNGRAATDFDWAAVQRDWADLGEQGIDLRRVTADTPEALMQASAEIVKYVSKLKAGGRRHRYAVTRLTRRPRPRRPLKWRRHGATAAATGLGLIDMPPARLAEWLTVFGTTRRKTWHVFGAWHANSAAGKARKAQETAAQQAAREAAREAAEQEAAAGAPEPADGGEETDWRPMPQAAAVFRVERLPDGRTAAVFLIPGHRSTESLRAARDAIDLWRRSVEAERERRRRKYRNRGAKRAGPAGRQTRRAA